jgi:hypothetical protein
VAPQAVEDGFGAWAHELVPLQVRVMHNVSLQVIAVPWQAPPEQASL